MTTTTPTRISIILIKIMVLIIVMIIAVIMTPIITIMMVTMILLPIIIRILIIYNNDCNDNYNNCEKLTIMIIKMR